MLRPIKSILSYLQLNLNDSEVTGSDNPVTLNAMSDELSRGDKVVESTVLSSSGQPLAGSAGGEDKSDANSDLVVSPSDEKSTPHDQNENEVILLDRDEDSQGKCCTKSDTDDVLVVEVEVLDPAIDLTDSESVEKGIDGTALSSISNFESSGPAQSNVEVVIDADAYMLDNSPKSVAQEHEDVDNVGSQEGISIISEEDKEAEDSDVYIVPESATTTGDDAQILCDEGDDHTSSAKIQLLDICLESREVIMLEEIEHAEVMSDPLNDPLAIDDYNADISSNINAACGSTGHSDASTEGDILFAIADETDHTIPDPIAKTSGRIMQRNRRGNYVMDAVVQEETNAEEQEVRSDGSDSGLGSETSTLMQTSSASITTDSPVCKPPPEKGNLKRRSDSLCEGASNKKSKNSIHFNGVKVYYFPRIQGFSCVPSQGGCTLGMAAHHVQSRTFSLAEHTAEQRRMHKQQMQEINPRNSSSDETDSDEEISEASGSDLDADANGFLQPVPARQRRAILKAAGIRKIDPSEKDECRAIRSSREVCGCTCRGYCDPDTCSCSQAGIKCQVDRPNFPCGCTRDGCANVVGRVEFNPSRVRTHYIHTIMRLDLENKQKRAIEMETSTSSSSILNYDSNSVTSAMNNCSSATSLSSLCSYNNLVSTNHMRQQQQSMYTAGVTQSLQQPNQTSFMSSSGNMYSNHVSNSMLTATSTLHVDSAALLRHILLDSNASNPVNGSNSSDINDSSSLRLQNTTNHSNDIDLTYAFRDSSSANVELHSPNNSNNILGLGDYSPSNPLYHEVYNAHSFLNQNYSNSNFCQSQNLTYQQSFIGYCPPEESPVDIADLTVDSPPLPNNGETNCSDPSYINLNSPVGNQSRLDAINDLLHNSRNLAATISTTQPSATVEQASTVSCSMAPSAQTSTSITESTQMTITKPQITKPTTSLNSTELSFKEVIDLTDRTTPQQMENQVVETNENSSGEDVLQVENVKIIKIDEDLAERAVVEETTPHMETLTTTLKSHTVFENGNSVLEPKTDIVDLTIGGAPATELITPLPMSSIQVVADENVIVETAIA